MELDSSEVFCFGLNRDGLLGYQDTTNRWLAATPAPEYMEGIQDIAIGGRYFACFQLVDMTVKCIGNNGKGEGGEEAEGGGDGGVGEQVSWGRGRQGARGRAS